MKQNKKLTYLLIALFMGVWILVIYRVFKTVGSDQSASKVIEKQQVSGENTEASPVVYTLAANYRDPFLGAMPVKKAISSENIISVKKEPKPVKVVEMIDWRFISFTGLISNPDSKRKIALVNLFGKEMAVAEGSTQGEVSFLQHTMDSIKISYHGQTHFIRK